MPKFDSDGNRVGGRRASARAAQTSGFSTRFVRGELTADEREACKNWADWEDGADGFLEALIFEGFRVTLKADDQDGGYVVFLNPIGEEHRCAGWALTGRGSTPLKAIKQACFRHFVVFDRAWPTGENRGVTNGYDD